MTANAQPIFVGAVRNGTGKVITGTTSDMGVGATQLFQADPINGSRIHAISAVYEGTVTTQTVLRLWLENAGSFSIIAEIPLPLYTVATGTPAPVLSLLDYNHVEYLDPADRFLTLAPSERLYVSVLDTIEVNLQVTAFGGDY